jgi:hypothetical protein
MMSNSYRSGKQSPAFNSSAIAHRLSLSALSFTQKEPRVSKENKAGTQRLDETHYGSSVIPMSLRVACA